MKKALLGTTALVAASLVGGSFAQAAEDPISIGIGGYYRAAINFIDQDDATATATTGFDQPGANQHSNSFDQDIELTLSGSTTLDNGLTVGVSLQLEGATVSNSESSSLDERFLFFRGSFGMARFGVTESARQEMTNFAPNGAYNFGVNTPFFTFWSPNDFRGFTEGDSFFYVHTYDDDLGVEDQIKILYFSPTFNGLRLGVSYSPDDDEEGAYGQGSANDVLELQNNFSVGGEYSNDFGDFSLRAAVGYESYKLERCGTHPTANGVKTGGFTAVSTANLQNCNNDPTSWHAGATVSFGPWSVGGGYLSHDGIQHDVNGAEREKTDFDLGISYWSGPYGAAILWGHAESEETDGFEDEIDIYAINGTYILGPGIDFQAQIDFGEFDDGSPAKQLDNEWVELIIGSAITF